MVLLDAWTPKELHEADPARADLFNLGRRVRLPTQPARGVEEKRGIPELLFQAHSTQRVSLDGGDQLPALLVSASMFTPHG